MKGWRKGKVQGRESMDSGNVLEERKRSRTNLTLCMNAAPVRIKDSSHECLDA